MNHLMTAIYARVSGDHQVESGTIESQVSELHKRAQQDGIDGSKLMEFIDDGYSGYHLLRPALEKLRDTAALGGIQRLYVLEPDRLSRKYAYQVYLLDEFKRSEVEVIFLNRPLSESPEDELLLQVQGIIAEYERAKMKDRTRRGRIHKAKSGRVSVLGGAPYGFRYIPKKEGAEDAEYRIHAEEAEVVRKLFRWYGVERVSMAEVQGRLQDEKIDSPGGKSRWGNSTLVGLLRNPAYKGLAAYGKKRSVEEYRPSVRVLRGSTGLPLRPRSFNRVPAEDWLLIPVPAIVSEAVFEAAQEQLEANRKRTRARKKQSPLLSGLVVCAHCGYAFHGMSRNKKYLYYRCAGTNPTRFEGVKVCDNPQVNGHNLEDYVWTEVSTLLSEPGRLEEEFHRRLEGKKKTLTESETVTTRINRLQRKIARLIDSYADEIISKEEFEPRVSKARQALAKLQEEWQKEQETLSSQRELRLLITRIEELGEQLQQGLETADLQTRRDLLRMLVKRIEVSKETVTLVFRVASSPFDLTPARGFCQHQTNLVVGLMTQTDTDIQIACCWKFALWVR